MALYSCGACIHLENDKSRARQNLIKSLARARLEKGLPGIQHLRAYQIIPFFWNFVFFSIFSVYQLSIQSHGRVNLWSQSTFSIIV